MKKRNLITCLLFWFMPLFMFTRGWQTGKAILMTKYAKDVNPANVLPEHPRPSWFVQNGLV